jgi:hypothetical protein
MQGRPVRGDSGATRSQPLADERDEFRVVEQCVDGVEQVVLEENGLARQGHIEQRRLASSGSDHVVLDYIEYDT